MRRAAARVKAAALLLYLTVKSMFAEIEHFH
jgi:hypothetical protein